MTFEPVKKFYFIWCHSGVLLLNPFLAFNLALRGEHVKLQTFEKKFFWKIFVSKKDEVCRPK
jgi:hypothetical protein